jgi:three-Cys-motif partner protein
MQAYLEPRDDGLFMREAGTWAREKLDYLKRYIDVFETAMRKKWSVRCYVDLFAGPGKNVDRDSGGILLGSPLIALTATYPFTGYFFTDLSDKHTKTLRQRCTASPHSQRVQIWTGDCNDLVNEIVAQIKQDDWRSLNLAFLDPTGIDLRWDTVAKLATIQRMDLIIHYPEGGLNRSISRAFKTSDQTSIDGFFGERGWRKIYQDWLNQGKPSGLHRQLIDFYKGRLQHLGYREVLQADQVGEEPLIRNVRRGAPLYRLLFASKHPLGHDFWHKVTRRDVYGQRRFDF